MISLLYPIVIQAVFVYLSIERREWILGDTVTAFSLTGLFCWNYSRLCQYPGRRTFRIIVVAFFTAWMPFLSPDARVSEHWMVTVVCACVIVCRTLNLMWWRFSLQNMFTILSTATVDHGQGRCVGTEHSRTCTVSTRRLLWSLRERTSQGCFFCTYCLRGGHHDSVAKVLNSRLVVPVVV